VATQVERLDDSNSFAAAELGFFATTSIEAIYVCLQKSGLLPACQNRGWDGLWDDSAFDETSE
jgi:hypothetical protein